MGQTKNLSLMFTLWLLSACDQTPAIIADCQSTNDIEAICLFSNPEDLELLADQQTLIISQTGDMEGHTLGNLVSFNTETLSLTQLYPRPLAAGDSPPLLDSQENWGAANCLSPQDQFSPHGTSLKQRHDGRWQLAVVNHRGRESIEMFEVLDGSHAPELVWRGCVIPPAGTYMNDVALLGNGGFVASHMFERHSPIILGLRSGLWKAQLGINTGHVFEWQPDTPEQFRILEESHGPFINGIEMSADEEFVFANVYSGKEVRKLDRVSGKKLGAARIPQVDNTSWDTQGRLLGVSHTGSALDQMDCMKHPGETCAFGFTIVRIDPNTMHAESIFQHQGAPMGAATIARQVGTSLYLGSFSGNRIIRIAYPSTFQ